jgi:transposase-like protein
MIVGKSATTTPQISFIYSPKESITIHRWGIRYVPEFEKRWNRFARPVNNSWRVDETYIKVRGEWNFLYRAVDKHGKTVDFLLRPDRRIAAAQAFFRKALSRYLPRWPRKITLDGLKQSHLALRYLRREDALVCLGRGRQDAASD